MAQTDTSPHGCVFSYVAALYVHTRLRSTASWLMLFWSFFRMQASQASQSAHVKCPIDALVLGLLHLVARAPQPICSTCLHTHSTQCHHVSLSVSIKQHAADRLPRSIDAFPFDDEHEAWRVPRASAGFSTFLHAARWRTMSPAHRQGHPFTRRCYERSLQTSLQVVAASVGGGGRLPLRSRPSLQRSCSPSRLIPSAIRFPPPTLQPLTTFFWPLADLSS